MNTKQRRNHIDFGVALHVFLNNTLERATGLYAIMSYALVNCDMWTGNDHDVRASGLNVESN